MLKKGYKVTVNAEGLENYKTALLCIVNTVREYKCLLKFENYYGNDKISVFCTEDSHAETFDWLQQFGKVETEEIYYKIVRNDLTDDEWNFVYEEEYSEAIIIDFGDFT